jgi:transposase
MSESTFEERVRAVERYKHCRSLRMVAQEFGRSKDWVNKWVKRDAAGESLEDCSRSGRPKKLTPEQEQKAISFLKDEASGTLRKARKRLREEEKLDISNYTLLKVARKYKVKPVKEIKKPKLTDKQKEDRLEFASTSRAEGYWNRVLFTDECIFPVFGPPIIRWIGEEDEIPVRLCVKNSPHVMVWAGIGSKGKTRLFKIEQGVRLNSEGYQELLSKALPSIERMWPQRDRWILMQDGAPCHRARATMEFLKSKGVRVLHPWPANSPDLNPIENMWHILKDTVYRHKFTTVEELWSILKQEWAAISKTQVKKLIDSMPRRLKSVVESNGAHTKY